MEAVQRDEGFFKVLTRNLNISWKYQKERWLISPNYPANTRHKRRNRRNLSFSTPFRVCCCNRMGYLLCFQQVLFQVGWENGNYTWWRHHRRCQELNSSPHRHNRHWICAYATLVPSTLQRHVKLSIPSHWDILRRLRRHPNLKHNSWILRR